MGLITRAIQFLTIPPGDLVYHLIVLFAIEAMVVMALRRSQTDRERRWMLATLGLGSGPLILILAAALAALRIIPTSAAITPPLERFVEAASLSLLAWAFLSAGYTQIGIVISLIISAPSTPGLRRNGFTPRARPFSTMDRSKILRGARGRRRLRQQPRSFRCFAARVDGD